MSIEPFYRGLLLSYPYTQRQRYGDEILGVLMDEDDARSQEPAWRRGSRRFSEGLTLLGNGLAARLRVRGEPGAWRRPGAAIAVVLATVLAVIAVQQFVRAGFGTAQLYGRHHLWIDTSWPAAVLAIAAFGFVVLRWQLPALVAATGAAAVAIWFGRSNFRGVSNWGIPDDIYDAVHGSVGRISTVSRAETLALFLPTVLLVLVLLVPHTTSRIEELYRRRTLLIAFGTGVVVALWTDWQGMSMIWAPIIAGMVLIPGLFRGQAALRGGLVITFAFCYLPVSQQADGTGSKIPTHGWPLALSLGAIPLVVFMLALLAVPQFEHSGLRQWVAETIENFGRSIRDRDEEAATE